MSPITIAIAGATGLLGAPVTRVLLSKAYYPSKISKVIILTRDTTSANAKALTALGAEAVQASDDSISAKHLEGVDVFVNTLSGRAPAETTKRYADAAAAAKVKVYFPSEFGVDARVIDVDHEIWNGKKECGKYAASLGLKVISLYTGGFLDISFMSLFGFDFNNKVFSTWGETSTKVSYTALKDIGASVAELSLLAVENPSSVPDHVRISGDAKSTDELAAIFGQESGDKITTQGLDRATKKAEIDALSHGKGYQIEYLRLIIGSGAVDFSKENDNELVNPGGKKWAWRTVTDVAKETKGRPDSRR